MPLPPVAGRLWTILRLDRLPGLVIASAVLHARLGSRCQCRCGQGSIEQGPAEGAVGDMIGVTSECKSQGREGFSGQTPHAAPAAFGRGGRRSRPPLAVWRGLGTATSLRESYA